MHRIGPIKNNKLTEDIRLLFTNIIVLFMNHQKPRKVNSSKTKFSSIQLICLTILLSCLAHRVTTAGSAAAVVTTFAANIQYLQPRAYHPGYIVGHNRFEYRAYEDPIHYWRSNISVSPTLNAIGGDAGGISASRNICYIDDNKIFILGTPTTGGTQFQGRLTLSDIDFDSGPVVRSNPIEYALDLNNLYIQQCQYQKSMMVRRDASHGKYWYWNHDLQEIRTW